MTPPHPLLLFVAGSPNDFMSRSAEMQVLPGARDGAIAMPKASAAVVGYINIAVRLDALGLTAQVG
jgi:hypothetical protein